MEKILQELDALLEEGKAAEAERFLDSRIAEAVGERRDDALITLLNEMIGFLRTAGKFEKCMDYCGELLTALCRSGLEGSVAFATSLLNIATACRAAGRYEEAMEHYNTVFSIYQGKLEENDYRYASLYNNLSLLYQEMGQFEISCEYLEKALAIVSRRPECEGETATTHTNLALSLLKLGRYRSAIEHLQAAFAIYEKSGRSGVHYSGALAAMGEAQYRAGNYEEASRYYRLAMEEIQRNGGGAAYEIVARNLQTVEEQMKQRPNIMRHFEKGMDLCEEFFYEYGLPLLRERFAEYLPFIAAGLVGEGSECFGFDDEISRDHDFGPGFCLFLTDSVYEEIGEELQAEYDRLPTTYAGVTRRTSPKAPKRVGVFRIGEFYERLIGQRDVPVSQNEWLFVQDYQLAAATNGRVFLDELGEFTRIRRGLLAHYPEDVRVKKLAREAALIAQSGQYNYSRMLQRGDKVAAQVALGEFMRHTMMIVYLLNRKYAPFYKWMHRGMKKLALLSDVGGLLEKISEMQVGDERIVRLIETIVARIIQEMSRQSLTTGSDNYLDHHTDNILHSIPQKEEEAKTVKEELVDKIVSLEWQAFDQVQNRGGRADCQDNWNTFSIMRKSQYLTWPIPLLQSYLADFEAANAKGWNLITEKYARMMASTAPEEYAEIEGELPKLPEEKKRIIEAIVQIQVGFMEECAREYPKAASDMRSIHTSEDTPLNTSYETYLRGELSTYSDATLDLYGRFIAKLCQEGKNLAKMTITNSAKLYGYSSLQDLEERL